MHRTVFASKAALLLQVVSARRQSQGADDE
jgi:hypothetical protein